MQYREIKSQISTLKFKNEVFKTILKLKEISNYLKVN